MMMSARQGSARSFAGIGRALRADIGHDGLPHDA
jgi:hypothetical protein